MKKLFLFFLSLTTLITMSAQSKQFLSSGTSQQVPHITKTLRQHNDGQLQMSAQQRVSRVQGETNVLKQQLDSMIQPGYKSTYTYDNAGRKLTECSWYKDNNNRWIVMTKDSSIYDTNGQLLTYIEFSGSYINNNLIPAYKTDYQYNENEIIEMKYGWSPNSETWIIRYKTVITYDNSGKIMLALTSFWNVNSWAEEHKTVYEYDANANIITKTEYNWSSGEWMNVSKIMYNYDPNGNEVGRTTYLWSTDTQEWTGSEKFEMLLNNDFDISTICLSTWDATTEMWELYIKSECTYDLNTLASDVFSNGILNALGKHKLNSAEMYQYNGTNWSYLGLVALYFSTHDFQSGTKTILEDDVIKVYPNPTSNYIIINRDKMIGQCSVQLADLRGKVVLNKKLTNTDAVSTANLPKGLYLYKILSDNKTYNGKVLIK